MSPRTRLAAYVEVRSYGDVETHKSIQITCLDPILRSLQRRSGTLESPRSPTRFQGLAPQPPLTRCPETGQAAQRSWGISGVRLGPKCEGLPETEDGLSGVDTERLGCDVHAS